MDLVKVVPYPIKTYMYVISVTENDAQFQRVGLF